MRALVIWIATFAVANVALAYYARVLTSFVNQIPGRDKAAHFVVMGLFGALVTLSVRDRRARIGSFAIPVGIPLVIVLVTLEEVSQIGVADLARPSALRVRGPGFELRRNRSLLHTGVARGITAPAFGGDTSDRGPDVEEALDLVRRDVLVLLAEATPVFPERCEGEWALVLTPSGTAGWIQQSLLRTR
jgi:hypothetical protein